MSAADVALSDNQLGEFPRREFYMGRHGETEHVAKGTVSTHFTMLTLKGEEEAAGRLRQTHDAHLPDRSKLFYISSDAPRAIETCRQMTGDGPVHRCIPELAERVNGRAGGLITQEFYDSVRYDENYLSKKKPGKNLTNRERFRKLGMQFDHEHVPQVIKGMKIALSECPEDKIPVIISHSGTIRHTAAALEGITGFKPVTAGFYHFIPEGEHGWKITEVQLGSDGKTCETPLAELSAKRRGRGD